MVDEIQLQRLLIEPLGVQPEDAHVLEQEVHAARVPHVPAAVLEVHADVGHGAHHVVRGRLHHDRDAVRAVALVQHHVVALHVLAARALDGRLDLVLGHVARPGVLQRPAQRRIAVRAGPAGLHRDGDVLADAREQLRHLVPAGEHRRLASLENASHGSENAVPFVRGPAGMLAP